MHLVYLVISCDGLCSGNNVFIHGFTALHSTSFSQLSTCIVLQLLQGNTKEQRENHVTLQMLSRGTHGVPLQVKSVQFLT